jgi:hypothetical protein
MKTALLLFAFLPLFFTAQVFDQSNEPAIGALASLHLCDSNANHYANVVGNNVTWDYSQLSGIFGVTKDIQVTDATLDVNYASFLGATKMYDVGGTFQTFFSSTAGGRVSQGFVFNEVSLGAVIASWTVNQENIMSYPFAFSNSVADQFSGDVNSTATGIVPATGASFATFDGKGTLLLPGNNTYNNVLRYHLKDSATAMVFGTPVAFVREAFEYYELTLSNLPIFVVLAVDVNSAIFANQSTMVLSKDMPTTFVGLANNQIANIKLYPNPANTTLSLSDEAIGQTFNISNTLGATVANGVYANAIDVTNLDNGVYYLQMNQQVFSFVKN